MLRSLWSSLRPIQWTKNLIAFAGVIFSQQLGDPWAVARAVAAFAVFCAASSSGYLANDIADRTADAAHPRKRNRPLASGRLGVPTAGTTAFILGAAALFAAWLLGGVFFQIVLGYLALELCYSILLKRVVILDVILIAIGFVLRAIGGVVAVDAEISPWLFVCTMLLALFLALAKRRAELVSLGDASSVHRVNLADYSVQLLDHLLSVVAAATLVSYSLYTLAPRTLSVFGTPNMIYTIPFVAYGLFRYLYLIHRKEAGEQPERVLLTDIPLSIGIVLWLAACLLVMYLS
jgi:4-hydroxybenzoate polyprenyltransferase